MKQGSGRRWGAMTAPEAKAAGEGDPVVVLPLAALEQHGPHLPLSTDLDIGLGILERALGVLPEEALVWTLPPLVFGASDEHLGFPGTVSLGAAATTEALEAVGRSLAASGVRRLVLANSHGGNRFAMEEAALRLRRDRGMLVVKASWFRFPRPEGVHFPEAEWRHGLHGGALETAMMLHLHPESVRVDAVRAFPSLGAELEESLEVLGPEGPASFGWLAEDLNAQGVTGDATLATSEVGAALVRHYGDTLARVLLDAADFPLNRLAAR